MRTTTTLKALTLVTALTTLGGVSAGERVDGVTGRSLEPCLNGEVSASGLYPTQQIEERVLASGRSLDASLNGQVSANGLYPTQAMEDAVGAEYRRAGNVDTGLAVR